MKWFFNPCPVLYIPFPVLYNPFPVNKLPSNDAPNVPNNILKNPQSCFLVLFLIVLVVPFNNISCSSNAVAILIKSFKSLLEIIKVISRTIHFLLNCSICS